MGQEISVNVTNTPLNSIIIKIADEENLHFSFDDEQLSKVMVSYTGTFLNINEVLQVLLKGTNLSYEYIDNVWIIYPRKKKKDHIISGQIIDNNTHEASPIFSHTDKWLAYYFKSKTVVFHTHY